MPPALAACSQLAQRHKQKGREKAQQESLKKSFLTIEWKNYSVSINISLIIHSPFLSEEEQQKKCQHKPEEKNFLATTYGNSCFVSLPRGPDDCMKFFLLLLGFFFRRICSTLEMNERMSRTGGREKLEHRDYNEKSLCSDIAHINGTEEQAAGMKK